MGCPDTNIVKKGGGAALLLDLPRAGEIIDTLIRSRAEWQNGKTLANTDLPDEMKDAVKDMAKISIQKQTRVMPISIKTRIGYHDSQVAEVIPFLIEKGVERIAIHGRTFDARYSGNADWDEIAKAKELTKGTPVQLLGNGDIRTMQQARDYITRYGVDGVLIARGAFGNPWFFSEKEVPFEERIKTMLYHAELFLAYRPELDLRPMRKHLSWYCKGMEGSAKLRDKLMKVVDLQDLKSVLQT